MRKKRSLECEGSFLKEILKGPYEDEKGKPVCAYCHEPVLPNERITEVEGPPLHYECGFRMVFGSVGHMKKQCMHYGKKDTSEEGMALREGAQAAYQRYKDGRKRIRYTATG